MSDPISAYPLQWPQGWPRMPAHQRTRAKFHGSERVYSSQPGGSSWMRKRDLTISEATQRVLRELQTFGVLDGDAIISTNLALRLDGLPRSGQAQPNDPGVAVYWERPGERGTKVMAVDRYDRVADNLAAIAATLEAMRAIERHGGAQILERAFTGFTALPDPSKRNWRDVLGTDITTLEQLETVYKRLRSESHPDKGGSADRFHDVQRAYEQGREALSA